MQATIKVKSITKRPGKAKKAERALAHLVFDPVKLEASLCRDSFMDFVQRFWDTVVMEPLVWNWHMTVMCMELQEAAERVFRNEPKKHDIVINVPPGSSKSLICSVFFPAWVWTRMPSCKSICASYSDELALDLSRKSRDVVQSDKWTKLFGNVEIREDQNTKGYFLNKHTGYRYATSTNGTVTGFHGHFIIVDDPLDPKRAASEADLKTANTWITETLETRKVDKAVTVRILIMQRLHQNDPSAAVLKFHSEYNPIRHLKFPAEIQGNGYDQVRPRKYARLYRKGLLDPVRLPRNVLKSLLPILNEYGYAGQMLQNPVPKTGGMFKVDRISLEAEAPKHKKFKDIVRFWDKAGTKGGGAYTVGVLMGLDRNDEYWVLDVIRGQWESGTREKIIKQTAALDGADYVTVGVEQEPGSGGKESAELTGKRLAGYRVRIVKPTGDKELRADPYSVQVNLGVVHVLNRPWTTTYLDELKHFPASTYKDQVDASSGAFSLLTRKRIRIGGLRSSKKRKVA